jgi:hypothetical protein
MSITRRNRERAIGVFANILPGKSQADALSAVEKIAEELPEGYRVEFTGGSQSMKETIGSFWFAFILGLVIAYMILASQFNNYLHPAIVLLAMPFAITGALIALFVSNQSINLYSAIAFILLMGIVKKNSILLVEFTNHVRLEKKKNIYDSLMEACPVRLRPILMTSISTIAAAVPAALAFGPGAETRTPMAVAVIGGVLVSTALTLYVVPSAYRVLSKYSGWIALFMYAHLFYVSVLPMAVFGKAPLVDKFLQVPVVIVGFFVALSLWRRDPKALDYARLFTVLALAIAAVGVTIRLVSQKPMTPLVWFGVAYYLAWAVYFRFRKTLPEPRTD